MNKYKIETAKQQNGRWTVKIWEHKDNRDTVLLYTTELSKAHETEEEATQEGRRFLASHNKGKPYTSFQDRLCNPHNC
jgi:hypothetical protein